MFERTKDLRLSIIKQVELKSSRYPDIISLAQGIPSFDTPGSIKRRVEVAIQKGAVAKYSLTPGLPELRELIELELSRENMYYDWQKEIIVTAGSIEGITAALLAVASPGDEIIIPDPTYTSFREAIILAGCKPVYVPLNESRGWAFELDKFENAVTEKSRAFFYCNPNNPTGTIYSREQLMGLAELAQKHDMFIISDEVYKDFVYDKENLCQGAKYGEKEHIFTLAEVPELRKRVIRIYSLSKAYSMTGWRIGYLHSDASVTAEILKVHDSLVTCAPVISQYGAMGAFEMAEKDVVGFVEEFRKRRDLVCRRLDQLGEYFEYIKPEGAYYVFPRIKENPRMKIKDGKADSWEFAMDLIEKVQVAVVPGFAFGPQGEGHFRINFGRKEEDINRAFDRIDEYCDKYLH